MPTPIKFGRQVTVLSENGITTIEEEVIAHTKVVKKSTIYRETMFVRNDQDILSAFLKLMDRYKAGEIDQPGAQVLRDRNSGQLRLETTWVAPEL